MMEKGNKLSNESCIFLMKKYFIQGIDFMSKKRWFNDVIKNVFWNKDIWSEL